MLPCGQLLPYYAEKYKASGGQNLERYETILKFETEGNKSIKWAKFFTLRGYLSHYKNIKISKKLRSSGILIIFTTEIATEWWRLFCLKFTAYFINTFGL
jgi:hypothetical protein